MSRNVKAAIEYTRERIVTSRKGRVSRNVPEPEPATQASVTSRKGRVSRNEQENADMNRIFPVTSRKGRVSRNVKAAIEYTRERVTSRKGRVSRNFPGEEVNDLEKCHVPQGACE